MGRWASDDLPVARGIAGARMSAPSLALVIPTYCRADLLRTGLEQMASELVTNRVALYISDDSPDATTQDMVSEFAERIPTLHYRRNAPALRHDRNIVRSLLWPSEDYVWILGDAGIVNPGAFGHVISMLRHCQDFVFVNSHAEQTSDIEAMRGELLRVFVRDKFWHQTLTGATVYSRRVLEWLREHSPEAEGLTPNFPHLAILVDFLASHDASLGWIGTPMTRFSPKTSYWRKHALSVFVNDWSAVVRRQSGIIHPNEVPAVLQSHSVKNALFDVDLLVELRRGGSLNPAYLRNTPDAFHAVHLPNWMMYMIARLPTRVLSPVFTGIKVTRRLRRMVRV
jgi:hypothetical protein